MTFSGSSASAVLAEEEKASAFSVPATASSKEQRPRTLKHGDSFALFDPGGDFERQPGSAFGLFHEDMRHLARWQLEVDGTRPLLLGSTLRDDNSALRVDLTAPDHYEDGQLIRARDTIHLTRNVFLFEGACHERLAVRSYDTAPQTVRIAWRFAADFADLFEIRGHPRERRGTMTTETGPASTYFLYEGLDGLQRSTRLHFEPAPDRLTGNGAEFTLHLAPGEQCSLFVRIACAAPTTRPWSGRVYMSRLRASVRALGEAGRGCASVVTSNELVNRILCRSAADIRMLATDTPQGPYPYAGVPWFSTAFGRDGLITALEMLWVDPGLARGVLRFLAAGQARDFDPASDAQPGKILHETRKGEMARLGEVPFARYYGTIDATPLFVMLAGLYVKRTNDLALARELWPSIEAALEWIDRFGDRDGDGLVEYARESADGLVNQGWKDSYDSVFDEHGVLAQGPVALVEVQAYVYGARCHAARLARRLGKEAMAERQEAAAERLESTFHERFWCPKLGSYALALDGQKRPLRVRSSNAGHALLSGLARPDCAARLASELLSPAMFTGWGVRTLAKDEPRYNPMAYHNGSIWPHDNALLALGLSRFGHTSQALSITEGMLDAASYMEQSRLPELFCGFRRRQASGPTAYPVACAPQAWAAAAPFALLAACLGLRFDAERATLRLIRPKLPRGIDEISIVNLQLGDATLDLLLRRHGRDVAVNVPRLSGEAHVKVVL